MARMTPLWEAADSNDRLALLKEIHARLVDAIDECECVRDLEPLCRRLDVVSAEIDDLLARVPGNSPADAIAARRAQRRRKSAAG
jgi:hypothetical protein